MKKSKMNFKKIVLAGLVIFSLSNLQTKAQESTAGIKGGLNLSYLSVEDVDDNNLIPGFNAGVFAKVMITDRFGLQPEILYSTKGVKTVYDEEFLGFDIADGETQLNLNYLDIPIYLTFNLSEDFDFHFGPYVGFLMNANVDTKAEILEFINVDDANELDRTNFNTIDIGVSGGLGFNVDPLIIGFNYNLGLTQVAKEGESMEDLIGNAKNNNMQVYIGFVF